MVGWYYWLVGLVNGWLVLLAGCLVNVWMVQMAGWVGYWLVGTTSRLCLLMVGWYYWLVGLVNGWLVLLAGWVG